MDKDKIVALTCTRCGVVIETYAERCSSQGATVCPEYKEETKASDDMAFNREMSYYV